MQRRAEDGAAEMMQSQSAEIQESAVLGERSASAVLPAASRRCICMAPEQLVNSRP